MYKKYLVNMTNGTGVTTPVFLRWKSPTFCPNRLFIEVVKNTASWLPKSRGWYVPFQI